MTIDESKKYLRLMLGGMKYAVEYWKDRDKEESDIEQTNVEAVKIAIYTMRKYQKIEQIRHRVKHTDLEPAKAYELINEVMEHGNDT